MASTRRVLHFVFRVANRTPTIQFYRNILEMKVLRHEEFDEGCKAACNGPYDGIWSKSMVGYGEEDNHFVVELTYNYGVKKYERGNDYQNICIFSKNAFANVRKAGYSFTQEDDGASRIESPGGYPFLLYDQNSTYSDPVQSVCLSVSNLTESIEYWHKLLGMNIYSQTDTLVTLGYADNQVKLQLKQLDEPVNHAEAYGRIAFSCPRSELPDIEKSVRDAGYSILTPLVSLDTPGKATVEVVILADPDGHEICFVGDEAFRQLSQVDPKADQLINDAISNDQSDEWFAEQEKKKKIIMKSKTNNSTIS